MAEGGAVEISGPSSRAWLLPRADPPSPQASADLGFRLLQGVGEVVEGALAAVAPVTFAPRSVVVCAPRINVLALTPGTLEWTIFPSQCMNIGVTPFRVEKVVEIRE